MATETEQSNENDKSLCFNLKQIITTTIKEPHEFCDDARKWKFPYLHWIGDTIFTYLITTDFLPCLKYRLPVLLSSYVINVQTGFFCYIKWGPWKFRIEIFVFYRFGFSSNKSEYGAGRTATAIGGLLFRGSTIHFSNHLGENVVDICPILGGSFDKGAAP